jgi:LacI family gluconate utilization system Gnt-I transcriptional repressor
MTRKTSANLEDIARAAGVSKMTVSRVMRGGSGFSETTRDKVLAEAQRLNYFPNRIAAAFSSGDASTLIGLCVPRFTSSLFGHLTETIQNNLGRLGYQTVIGSHDQNPQDEELWLKSLAAWRPAGILLVGTRHTTATLDLLKNMSVPIIELWDLTTDPLDMAVGFSHHDCGLSMGRFAINNGRRKIGYVGASAAISAMGRLRQSGFEAALQEADVSLAAKEVLHDQPGFYAGFIGTETILARTPQLDAIYYHDDEMAIGGMAYLRKHGIKVKHDIGIAGWGAMEAASILPERLTTTDIPAASLGKLAAEMLVMRLRGDVVQDINVVPTRLIPGNTL